MLSAVNNNTPNFKAGYHIYFYTNDGKRIVSDANMKKCLHYMEAHLNGSKRVKEPNLDLIRNFALGQKKADGIRTGGDKDYFDCQRIRSVIDKTKDKIQGFINIVTGKDALAVDDMYGKAIGLSKGEGLKRAGTTRTFESGDAISRYIDKAPEYAESKAVYKNGERQAFGIAFTPIYYTKGKHLGEVKGFEYHHSGFFNESAVKNNLPTI